MISVDKLQNYLTKEESEEQYVFKVPPVKMADGHIYGKYVLDGKFAFIGKDVSNVPEWSGLEGFQQIVEKRVKTNSFTNALLTIMMLEYRYFDWKSREMFMKDLHRQIGYDMEEMSLYKDMGYMRIRKQIRESFINFDDLDGEELRQVIVDYFSLTVFIVSECRDKFGRTRNVERIAYVPSTWKKTERNEEFMKKNLCCILLNVDGKYVPVIKQDSNGLINWQEQGMEQLFERLMQDIVVNKKKVAVKKLEDVVIPKKVSLEKMQEIARAKGVSVTKEGKKGKMNKTIQELRDEIMNVEEKPEEEEKSDEVVDDKPEEVVEQLKEEKPEEVKKPILKIPKKITLEKIQEIAQQYGISVMKQGKNGELKKTITELREEIMEKVE